MVLIERLSPDQHERYHTIRLRALEEAPNAFGSTLNSELAYTIADWRRQLDNPASVHFVAFENGKDLGLAVGTPHHDIEGEAGLYGMWVTPEARGHKVSDKLVVAVIDWAHSSGFNALRLDVGDFNAYAQKLYERMGFTRTGRVGSLPPPRENVTEHELRHSLD